MIIILYCVLPKIVCSYKTPQILLTAILFCAIITNNKFRKEADSMIRLSKYNIYTTIYTEKEASYAKMGLPYLSCVNCVF